MPRTWKSLTILVIVALAAHFLAASRVHLPSQDGIKFIAIARGFGFQPAWDVIRGADQHPAYPALVAMAHRFAGSLFRTPADAWMAAAQGVSTVAALLTLIPLYLLTRELFRPTTAILAVFLWLLLPMPFALGHETLADATGLCFMAWALWAASRALVARGIRAGVAWSAAAGVAASAAYWTRPEGLLVAASAGCALVCFGPGGWRSRVACGAAFAAVTITAVSVYLTINGTVTDRVHAFRTQPVAVRQAVGNAASVRPKGLPEALRDPRYDFSPKDPVTEQVRPGLRAAAWSILRQWSESLGIALAVMTLWGLVRTRARDRSVRRLVTLHACVMLAALTVQAALRGYLSSRHVVGLTFLSVPFAAAALRLCGLRLAAVLRFSPRVRRLGTRAALAGMALIGITLQAKPIHASRLPHFQAGQWLARHAPPGAAVFDTRGWAAYLADLRRYDPYHFAQAVSDRNTKFWVLEAEELTSGSRRALTLAAILADGGHQEAVFRRKPGRDDGSDVLIFSWRRPAWWDSPHDRPRAASEIDPESSDDPRHDAGLRRANHERQEDGPR